jgi:hypothetical protein
MQWDTTVVKPSIHRLFLIVKLHSFLCLAIVSYVLPGAYFYARKVHFMFNSMVV